MIGLTVFVLQYACYLVVFLWQDSWYSLLRIIDWYGDHQSEMIPVAGPGHWNDPDQVCYRKQAIKRLFCSVLQEILN